jgi:hypothetical protein
MPRNMTPLQTAVIAILDRAPAYEWSVQGLGMLRLYIRDIGRIHIWDARLRYPGVTLCHTHSWDLESTIVFGRIINERYKEVVEGLGTCVPEPFWRKRIQCGYTFVETEPDQKVMLGMASYENYYRPGDTYTQTANEIHRNLPDDGTVTLIQHQHDGENGEAFVYWPVGAQYGNAKPRPATPAEVKQTMDLVLSRL